MEIFHNTKSKKESEFSRKQNFPTNRNRNTLETFSFLLLIQEQAFDILPNTTIMFIQSHWNQDLWIILSHIKFPEVKSQLVFFITSIKKRKSTFPSLTGESHLNILSSCSFPYMVEGGVGGGKGVGGGNHLETCFDGLFPLPKYGPKKNVIQCFLF